MSSFDISPHSEEPMALWTSNDTSLRNFSMDSKEYARSITGGSNHSSERQYPRRPSPLSSSGIHTNTHSNPRSIREQSPDHDVRPISITRRSGMARYYPYIPTRSLSTSERSSSRKQLQRRVRHSQSPEPNGTSDDGGLDYDRAVSLARRREIRRQRIESEQRRRDELRDGYHSLRDVLPVSNQKTSKVSLLNRAVTHIRQLESAQRQSEEGRLQAEAEVWRLRHVNESLASLLSDTISAEQLRNLGESAIASVMVDAAAAGASVDS